MKVTSEGIMDGKIADRFGCKGDVSAQGIPSRSLPLKFEEAPAGTACYAVFMEDKDAFPVSGGFSWVHWTAANITSPCLAEDESKSAAFPQGANSWISMQGGCVPLEFCSSYGGMAPPKDGGPHTYEIHVYALDALLPLQNGFGLHQLFRAMEGHILSEATLKGEYES